MKIKNKWFSLVELLVVITILTIISVVAYQNFGWATDKAISSRKISDLTTIESSLQLFKVEYKHYPMPIDYDINTNMWWYNSWAVASPSNTLSVSYDWQEISSVNAWTGGWKVMIDNAGVLNQIWAKWVIWYNWNYNKKYLSKELYDPEIWDIKISSGTSKKFIDKWLWRYVYAVYATPKTSSNWNVSLSSAIYYNLATTIKKSNSDTYETYIIWDYSKDSCWGTLIMSCPDTLIWTQTWSTSTWSLANKNEQITTTSTIDLNQWIPYPVVDFSK